MKYAFLIITTLFLTACTDTAPRGGGDILILGDSVMAWNSGKGTSIGDALETQLQRDVTNRAVVAAKFSNASTVASAVGFDIQRQYPGGQWNWIILDGGANDLGFHDCGCGACLPVVDRLISKDNRNGAIPSFLTKLRTSNAKVIWLGYYHSPGSSFKGCRDDLVEMEQRIARFAARTTGVFFLDGEDVINRNDLSHFARDQTHPSPKGSALLASLIASVITRSQTAN